jgi:hypothetical protein
MPLNTPLQIMSGPAKESAHFSPFFLSQHGLPLTPQQVLPVL